MFKLVIRFFIICILLTLAIAPVIVYLQTKLNDMNDHYTMMLLTQGQSVLLDEYLKMHPPSQWQSRIDKIRTAKSTTLTVFPIDKLPISQQKINQIKQNKTISVVDEFNPDTSVVVYKRIADSAYAYQELIDIRPIDRVHFWFDLPVNLIMKKLKTTPESQWPMLANKLSQDFNFLVAINNINNLPLNNIQKQQLFNKKWVVNLPKSDPNTQYFYVPIPNTEQALSFTVKMALYDTYKTYILIFIAFIVLELIVFIFALFFARSLDKLKLLADAYGKGKFDSPIAIKKTSTLFSLYDNLRAMSNRIKRLMASQKELTNSISHELRTPISRLRFSLELLKEAENKNEVQMRTTAMEDDIVELENLVAEILSYAQLDRTRTHSDYKSIQIGELIDRAVYKFKQGENVKKLEVIFSQNARSLIVQGNLKYILRALQNLLQNANRHAESLVRLSIVNNEIIIEDDGLGIPIEDREKIFEPFVQLSNASDNDKLGYGLGLAITKKVIDWHHWGIAITDSELGGAKFIINIICK